MYTDTWEMETTQEPRCLDCNFIALAEAVARIWQGGNGERSNGDSPSVPVALVYLQEKNKIHASRSIGEDNTNFQILTFAILFFFFPRFTPQKKKQKTRLTTSSCCCRRPWASQWGRPSPWSYPPGRPSAPGRWRWRSWWCLWRRRCGSRGCCSSWFHLRCWSRPKNREKKKDLGLKHHPTWN